MSESRDANDPRDAMRRMRKEAEREFEDAEASDSGGQEHASREDREGTSAAARRGRAGGPTAPGPGPAEPRDK